MNITGCSTGCGPEYFEWNSSHVLYCSADKRLSTLQTYINFISLLIIILYYNPQLGHMQHKLTNLDGNFKAGKSMGKKKRIIKNKPNDYFLFSIQFQILSFSMP